MKDFLCAQKNYYDSIINKIINEFNDQPLVFFINGEMGVGKTFFCGRIINALGGDFISSSSFGLVNFYNCDLPVISCDFYRTKWDYDFFELQIYPLLKDRFVLMFEWVSPVDLGKIGRAHV